MTTLLQRADAKISVWKMIQDAGGEMDALTEALLSDVDQNLAHKVDAYKFIQDELETEASRLKLQAEEFSRAAKSLDRVKEKLKDRIKYAMGVLEVDELKGELYRYKLSELDPKLIIDETLIPDDLKMVKTEVICDKERIREAWKSGENIAGVRAEAVFQLRTYVNKGEPK